MPEGANREALCEIVDDNVKPLIASKGGGSSLN